MQVKLVNILTYVPILNYKNVLSILQTRRLRGDLIETFKIITDKEQVNRETFFQMNRNVYEVYSQLVPKVNSYQVNSGQG